MEKRNHLAAILLSIAFGIFGFDRFYLGKIGTGILKGVTLGGVGIWYLVDIFLLLYNQQTDVKGQALEGQEVRDPTMLLYLSAFGGIAGFDRFYLGQTLLGIVKLLTLGGVGIWYLIDLYLVLKDELKDARGWSIQRPQKRYQSVALMFSITTGIFGLDRHYLGHRTMAMLKFFTFGGFFLFQIIDLFQIYMNSIKDVDGNLLNQG